MEANQFMEQISSQRMKMEAPDKSFLLPTECPQKKGTRLLRLIP